MENRRDSDSWHLEKTVSISHIISTVLVIISVLTFAFKMDTRVTILEKQIEYQKKIDDTQDTDRIRIATETSMQLRIINDKLDDLLIENRKRRTLEWTTPQSKIK